MEEEEIKAWNKRSDWLSQLNVGDLVVIRSYWSYDHKDGSVDKHKDLYLGEVVKVTKYEHPFGPPELKDSLKESIIEVVKVNPKLGNPWQAISKKGRGIRKFIWSSFVSLRQVNGRTEFIEPIDQWL